MKTMPLPKLHLLEKMLGMTGSTNDAEALVAMRKANAILKDHDLTWSELLRKQVGSTSGNYAPAQGGSDYTMRAHEPDDRDTVVAKTNAHVQRCLDTLRGKVTTDWFRSIDAQWAEKGYLSPDQRRPLFAMYEEHAKRE